MKSETQTHFPKELLEQPSAKPYFEFLRVDALSAGIYRLSAGSEDPQKPHAEDEVYYVLEGNGAIMVDGRRHRAEPGDAIYVPAFVEHRFVDIREDLTVLVFFSNYPVG